MRVGETTLGLMKMELKREIWTKGVERSWKFNYGAVGWGPQTREVVVYSIKIIVSLRADFWTVIFSLFSI